MHWNDSYSGRRGGGKSFYADVHDTACMIMHGNASDYLIMDDHVCDENA